MFEKAGGRVGEELLKVIGAFPKKRKAPILCVLRFYLFMVFLYNVFYGIDDILYLFVLHGEVEGQ
jgi:hypothetical protein